MDTDSNAHLRQWKHNREFLGSIPAGYPDWIVTVAFYTALHVVDALLAADKVRSITSHEVRNTVLIQTNRYQNIFRAYQPLYVLSRTVRYLADPTKWIPAGDVESNVFRRYLYPIEQSVFKLLGVDEKVAPIAIPTTRPTTSHHE